MKKTKLFGLAAMAVLLLSALALIGCPDPNGDPGKYALTVVNGTIKDGTATTGQYEAGASVTVVKRATAATERFTGWTGVGITIPADTAGDEYTFAMPANAVTVTANFEQMYTVTVEGGSIKGTGASSDSFPQGASVTVVRRASGGTEKFTGWTGTGITILSATTPEYTFTMPANAVTITASFKVVTGDVELYEYFRFTSDGWGTEGYGGKTNLIDDNGVLAIGPKDHANSVWALMSTEQDLALDVETLRSHKFVIKNIGTDDFINVKDVAPGSYWAVEDGVVTDPPQVKVSLFENSPEFWWGLAGSGFDGSQVWGGCTYYNGATTALADVVGTLNFLGSGPGPKPSGGNPDYYGVYFLHAINENGDALGDWNSWDPGAGPLQNTFEGRNFNLIKAE